MPDEIAAPPARRFAAAVEAIERYLGALPGAERLAPLVVSAYGKGGYELGWQLPVEGFPDGVTRRLRILVCTNLPYRPPRIAVADPPPVLTWPHLETDGLLCLVGDDQPVSAEQPLDMLKTVLGQAHGLISASIEGRNRQDFRDEFVSYWLLAVDREAEPVVSLLEPRGPSRLTVVVRHEHKLIFAETEDALTRWLHHRGLRQEQIAEKKPRAAALIWLSEPLVPDEYPRTGADVRRLAQAAGGLSVLEQAVAPEADTTEVILGARTANGIAFASVAVHRPPPAGPPGRRTDPVLRGFRANTIPRRQLANRFLVRTAKASKRHVDRADHAWVHGRDRDPGQDGLRLRRVAVVGCGSLGSFVAKNLAQAGVGNLLLVDAERMDWPNVGRHVLGGEDVGELKVEALRRVIERSFPHINEVVDRNEAVRPGADELIAELAFCDLVVSTMGNWAGEAYLNEMQQTQAAFPPVLYGWLEPAAIAAHAVLIRPQGPCLRCGIDATGRPSLEVTAWPGQEGVVQVPGCGATFTPYGPTDLAWGHALVARAAVHALTTDPRTAVQRTWIGYRSDLETAGGIWAQPWVTEMGDPGAGGTTTERQWSQSDSCPVCARNALVA